MIYISIIKVNRVNVLLNNFVLIVMRQADMPNRYDIKNKFGQQIFLLAEGNLFISMIPWSIYTFDKYNMTYRDFTIL